MPHPYFDDPAFTSKWDEVIGEYRRHAFVPKALLILAQLALIAAFLAMWVALIYPNLSIILLGLSLGLFFVQAFANYLVAHKYLRCPRCKKPNPGLASQGELLGGGILGPEARVVRHCFWCALTIPALNNETPNKAFENGRAKSGAPLN